MFGSPSGRFVSLVQVLIDFVGFASGEATEAEGQAKEKKDGKCL